MPKDEDLVHSILKMLSSRHSMEVKAKAHAEKTSEDSREWFRQLAEFHRREGHAGGGAEPMWRSVAGSPKRIHQMSPSSGMTR